MIFDMEDASGSTAALQIRIKPGNEPAAAFDAAAGFVSALLGCSDAIIRRISIRYSFVPAVRPIATGGTPAQQGAALIYDCGGDDRVLVYVPGVRDEYFVDVGPGAGVLVDLSNSDVIGLTSALAASPIVNPFAVGVVSLLAAYRQDRP